MDEEIKEKFATLVKATVRFLQSEQGDEEIALKEPPPSLPKAPVVTKDEPKEKPPPPTPKKQEEPRSVKNWNLNPMPLPTEEPPQFTSYFPAHPLLIPIRLVVADPSLTFFLENVARALTKLMAPAALYEGKLDALLTNHSVQLVLAPLSLLKKRFPHAEVHHFFKIEGPTLLPLADQYDLELKQALWNTLKRFPTMPPSS